MKDFKISFSYDIAKSVTNKLKAADPSLDYLLSEDMANTIQREIDNEIMISLYEKNGWISVHLERLTSNEHGVDIQDWCNENIPEQEWNQLGASFVFKEAKYAEWFSLRWA